MIEIKNSIVYFYTQKLEGMMMRKNSILGQIKSFKIDDKTKSNKKDYSKGAER